MTAESYDSLGPKVGWRITNHSRFKVDVTLLFVDSEYGIAAVFPRAGSAADNMIPPGGHILTMRATTTPTTFDLDQIVTIAVKSAGQPIDFSVLEQTNLEAVRKSLRGAGDPTLDSPLGQLCQHALVRQRWHPWSEHGYERRNAANIADVVAREMSNSAVRRQQSLTDVRGSERLYVDRAPRVNKRLS